MKILFVDDKPQRYSALLSRLVPSALAPTDPVFASNLRDALDLLGKSTFDIAVVDMLIPSTPWGEAAEDGGIKLLTHLLEDDDLRRPKYLIGITASNKLSSRVSEIFADQPWLLVQTAGAGNPWEARLERLIHHVIEIERAQNLVAYQTDACILTALRVPEFEALSQAGFELEEPTQVDTATFAQFGRLDSAGQSLKLVAGCCLRMGAVESALLAAKMIERFRPKILVLAGICAGYEEKVQYGDVIVANPCWDYTSSKIAADEHGKRSVTYSPDYINLDTELVSRLDVLRQDSGFFLRVHSQWAGEKLRAPPALHVAPSATGPAVVADASVMEEIRREQHRATIGLEMEAYGVYSAARMASRPRPIVFSAKAVCDYGSMFKDDKYQKYAAYTSASVVYEFLKRFGAELGRMV